ncbi:MAG: flagellar basal body protein, partial [Tepidiformaceae bacterium]
MANTASGLTAQRVRMDTVSSNVANLDTTNTPEGGP